MVSTPAPQVRTEFNVSLKQYLNLCLFKYLNSSLKRVSSSTPSGSSTENKGFSFFTNNQLFKKYSVI